MTQEIKGWHVLTAFVLGFGIIISVNLTLAYSAVKTFPGLEVKSSYVASQSFDKDRASQLALGWEVSARLKGDLLLLSILEDGRPIAPQIEAAVFGRATHVTLDQVPEFSFDGDHYVAKVDAGPGNWNLRLKTRAKDGTLFQQRIVVEAAR